MSRTNYRRDSYDDITARLRQQSQVPKLKQLCAWCRVTIQDGALPVSHGICQQCAKRHFDTVLWITRQTSGGE